MEMFFEGLLGFFVALARGITAQGGSRINPDGVRSTGGSRINPDGLL